MQHTCDEEYLLWSCPSHVVIHDQMSEYQVLLAVMLCTKQALQLKGSSRKWAMLPPLAKHDSAWLSCLNFTSIPRLFERLLRGLPGLQIMSFQTQCKIDKGVLLVHNLHRCKSAWSILSPNFGCHR